MSISQATLERYGQPNVVLAEGYEFLCDVLQRFLESDLPERQTFLLARLDDNTWRVKRMDHINSYLSSRKEEQQYRELYRPLAELDWLLPVGQVVGINGALEDADVADWTRRREGHALVVMDGDEFVALIYTPTRIRSGIGKPLRELFPRWIGREETALPGGENGVGDKGLETGDRELTVPPGGRADASQPVSFHTDIRFSNWLKPGETRALTVQLTQEYNPASMAAETVGIAFAEEFAAETIHVHLDAPGFVEKRDKWQQAIEVYSFQDSDRATFILTAGQDETQRQISIDLRHRERLIGSARFVVQINSQPISADPAATDALTFRQALSAVEIPQTPPPPPDVELRVRADGRRLTFELTSPHQAVDLSHASMGGVELTSEPQAYIEERYNELNQFAATQPADADVIGEISDRLVAMGNSLFLALFPDKLKRAYWKLVKLRKQGAISSLHIISDEPWIPWEMVKPVDLDENEADDFLAQGWQVSRWLAGPGQVDKLHITAARLVAPHTDLDFVKREVDFFAGLSNSAVEVSEPLGKLAQVKAIAREGVELLHFSTHGSVNRESIDGSSILLDDNKELRADDLVGEAVFGMRKLRPFIFMNTCHGARMGFSLAGLGGWAGQMINQMKAGVFVGALWEVNDDLAADFALRFYTELQSGQTLGLAFHTARQGIREKAPANSTWLAYTLYGDPNIRISWGTEQ
ncbi:MAG: CHAT domain-containing protein [Caldilineaceae bacterium]|nr:CHAT domain-containing protein [Caldilineaceae bacterium]